MSCPADAPQWDFQTQTCRTCADIDLANPFWTGEGCSKCPYPTEYYDKYAKECVADCPLTAPIKSDIKVCTKCAEVYPDRILWQPMTSSCVSSCATEVRNDATPICKTCDEKDPKYPLWNGEACASCYSYIQSRPTWDSERHECRACGDTAITKGKSFWDTDKNECVENCAESYDIRRVCRLCKEIDTQKPVAYQGECVPCYTADSNKPKFNVET